MLYREKKLGYRTIAKPSGLIVPINVFDEEFFPDRAREIQWLDCKAYWVAGDGFSKTERYIEFQEDAKTMGRTCCLDDQRCTSMGKSIRNVEMVFNLRP